ncbi:MAG: hypothetical protein ACLFSU_05445 [Acholeplasmataceae bacterium]
MSEQLAKRIEDAYNELRDTISRIDLLSGIIEEIKRTSQEILDRYSTAIDPAKLTQIREQNKHALNEMIEDIQKIEANMTDFEVVAQQTKELVDSFSQRFSAFDDVFRKTKQAITDLDNKLLRLLKQAERQQQLGQNRFLQASKLFHASAEIEKYDELLALEKENNRLLKELLSKPSLGFNPKYEPPKGPYPNGKKPRTEGKPPSNHRKKR